MPAASASSSRCLRLAQYSMASTLAATIEMETGTVTLRESELFVVPKGVRHNPSAQDECLVMLIERKSTLHTGDVVNEKTRSLAEQLRPV